MRGESCCLGRFYYHHAIVKKFKRKSEKEAVIKVIEVHNKGKIPPKCEPTGNCCCPIKCCEYEIKERTYFWKIDGKPDTQTVTEDGGDGEDTVVSKYGLLKKYRYKKRRNSYGTTVAIAEKLKSANDLAYCILLQNCEHAASACVNGNPKSSNKEILNASFSLQSYIYFWRIFHALVWLLQGFFYAVDFCVYSTFVANNTQFDIFPPNIHGFVKDRCYDPDICVKIFRTRCDWILVSIFCLVFTIIFIISLFVFYQKLFKKGFLCKWCVRQARMDCFSRLLALYLIETVKILLEDPAYEIATRWSTEKLGAIVVVVIISFIGTVLMSTLSSVLTWLLLTCCTTTSRRQAKEFTRYFRCRGLARPIDYIVRRLYGWINN